MRRLSNFHRVVLAIGVLLVIAFGGYAVYWHNMAVSLRAGLEPWATARRAEGYRVAWQTAETEGFPFAFAFRFTAVKLGADRPAPADFFGPVVVARTAPWDLRHWTFTAPQGGNISSALGLAGFDMHDIAGSVELGEPRGVTVDANAAGFNGTGLARGTTIASVSAHLQLPPTPPLGHRDVAFDGALQLKDLKLASSLPGFGDTISDISFSLQLKGAVPPGAMTTALMRWRDDGGTVELRYARLHWGSLLVDATGTLALDDGLQPEGAFTAVITGQDGAVDLAVATGALQPRDANLAKAVLDVLARPGPNGEKAINLPLTVQQSQIMLGPAIVGQMPHINWDARNSPG